ncbi:tyrosine-type recombinase/integrase, partial [Plebeiibacterium sediminum]
MKRKLPVVLSQKEVTGLVHVLSNLKHRTILMLTYATGMRRDEVLNLKPSNIDSSRGVIRVSGKGQKVREIPIFDELLEQLRFYYKHYRPEKYLFEGKKRGKKYAQASWIFLIMLTPFPEAGSCDVFRMTFRRMLTPLS